MRVGLGRAIGRVEGSNGCRSRTACSSDASRVSCSIRRVARSSSASLPPGQDRPGDLVGVVDDPADFQVDLAGGLLAPGVGVAAASGEERAPAFVLIADPAELGAHPELGDHPPGDRRGPLEVAGGAVGDLAVDQLLGDRAGQEHPDVVSSHPWVCM